MTSIDALVANTMQDSMKFAESKDSLQIHRALTEPERTWAFIEEASKKPEKDEGKDNAVTPVAKEEICGKGTNLQAMRFAVERHKKVMKHIEKDTSDKYREFYEAESKILDAYASEVLKDMIKQDGNILSTLQAGIDKDKAEKEKEKREKAEERKAKKAQSATGIAR